MSQSEIIKKKKTGLVTPGWIHISQTITGKPYSGICFL